jgi:FtsH-binding integral membrane protein
LGYGLIAAALVYLAGSFVLFLAPEYASYIEPVYIVPLIAELSFCFWLLIKGVRNSAVN